MNRLLLAAALATSLASTPGHALTFNFSFDNLLGDVPGTVTGTIDGLTDNSTSGATAVFVTSVPALLGYPLSPSDNILTQSTTHVVDNSFTVTNGGLVAEDFLSTFTEANGDEIQLTLNSGIPQFLLVRFAANGVNFDLIADSATFEAVPQVPLPAALPLFATGIGGLGLLGWRRKRKAS